MPPAPGAPLLDKKERLSPRFSGAPRISSEESVVDARAVHRALTGIRDRLRLQEDELERISEIARNGAAPAQPVSAIEARVEQLRAELTAHLNTPADDIQTRVEGNIFPRMHALELQVAAQGQKLQEAFAVMGRTETNVRALIDQVDRLLEEMSRRPVSSAPPQNIEVTSEVAEPPFPRRPPVREPVRPRPPRSTRSSALFTAVEDLDEFEDAGGPRFRWKFPLLLLALLVALLAAAWFFYFRGEVAFLPGAPLETALTPIEQARAYEIERNYSKAEAVYRQLLAKDPSNVEVIRHLASVLYREDKVEESGEVLKKLNPPPADLPVPAAP